jgi:hypothetical protein
MPISLQMFQSDRNQKLIIIQFNDQFLHTSSSSTECDNIRFSMYNNKVMPTG